MAVFLGKQSLDLVEMLQREEEMLAAVHAANEEVSILEPLYHIIGTGCHDWGITSCASVAKFRSSLGKCHWDLLLVD